MHRAGFSCAASPSSGLGHLQIHGRLKQETATQSGCYTTDEEGVRTFMTSLQVASICPAFQKQRETPRPNAIERKILQVHEENNLYSICVCKILQGLCVALFYQMVEKATILALYPVVESIEGLSVLHIFP